MKREDASAKKNKTQKSVSPSLAGSKLQAFSDQERPHVKFLSKQINLFLQEVKSESWQRVERIVKTTAIGSSLIFLLATLFTLAYFWFLSAHGISLEKRAEWARTKISSLKKEEEVFLSLIKKLKATQGILDSRKSMAHFLKEIHLLFPAEVTLNSLTTKKSGETTISLSCPSLLQLEKLNEGLKQAIDEGKIASVKIGGVSKEKDSYKLTLNLSIQKSGD